MTGPAKAEYGPGYSTPYADLDEAGAPKHIDLNNSSNTSKSPSLLRDKHNSGCSTG
ncbi:hypothetical protein J6590_019280 [Homalodisca vitripennis]|nr:hypothetical protein J6590_019280 [Homalodisca vitripennis]